MWKQWGMGPVFAYETLLNARRWQVYAGRSVFVLVMLVGMTIVWIARDNLAFTPTTRLPTYQQMAKVGEWFFYAMAGIQVSLVLLAAPAAAAGSICMDRARGTLLHVMVTDLSDTEIVLGKLGAAGADRRADRVRRAGSVAGGLTWRNRVRSDRRLVRRVACLGRAGLRAGADHLGLGDEDARGADGGVHDRGFLADGVANLAGIIERWKVDGPTRMVSEGQPVCVGVRALLTSPAMRKSLTLWSSLGSRWLFRRSLVILSIARLRRVVVEQVGPPTKEQRRRLLRAMLKRLFPSWPSPQLDGNPVLWREWSRNRPSKLARRLWAGITAHHLGEHGLGNL